jgi:hypothetical protein
MRPSGIPHPNDVLAPECPYRPDQAAIVGDIGTAKNEIDWQRAPHAVRFLLVRRSERG